MWVAVVVFVLLVAYAAFTLRTPKQVETESTDVIAPEEVKDDSVKDTNYEGAKP